MLDIGPCCTQDLNGCVWGKGEEERDTTLPRAEINLWYDRYLKFGRNILVFDGKSLSKEGGKTREGNAD